MNNNSASVINNGVSYASAQKQVRLVYDQTISCVSNQLVTRTHFALNSPVDSDSRVKIQQDAPVLSLADAL